MLLLLQGSRNIQGFALIRAVFVPTLEENWMIMLGGVFLFSQISAIEIKFLTKKMYSPLTLSTPWN